MIAIFEDNTIWAFSAQQDTPAKKAEMEEIGHQTQLVRRMLATEQRQIVDEVVTW